MRYVLATALILLLCCGAAYSDDDQSISLTTVQQVSSTYIVARSANISRFTVTVDVSGSNFVASRPVPVTIDSRGYRGFVVLSVRQADPAQPWTFHYNWRWRTGGVSNVDHTDYVYSLPYRPGGIHRVDQGFLGSFSHYLGSGNDYAVDWGMPVGTIVCAARGGVIVAVRVNSSVGGADLRYIRDDNYIVIDHGDGTFGEYVHLSKDGALVKLGQRVKTGEPIGFSGDTGYSSAPHLHFAVFRDVDGSTRVTLPFKIRTQQGVVVIPFQGETY